MEYNFFILTKNKIVTEKVNSDYNFSQAPFGFVSYRSECSCDCSQELIDDFWNCIHLVLKNNNLNSDDFVRAIRAYDSNNKLYGEL